METDDQEPCPHCGEMIDVVERFCPVCGRDIDLPPGPEGDATGGLIPYRNPSALWAYYLAVFSLLPCFPLGVAAFLLGLRGLRAARQQPGVRGTAHAWIGIVLGGLCGLGWLVVTLALLLGWSPEL